uniref:Uncharacterized protein n=1 Tax=Populus alba TaxID=43335 RepID=A0A4U5R6P2_POPAL|nr:hypothetical protein D5086_0000011560 [Populus alba]
MMKKARPLQVIRQRGDIGKVYVDCNWLRRPAWDLLLGHVGYVNLFAGVRVTSCGYVVEIVNASYKNRSINYLGPLVHIPIEHQTIQKLLDGKWDEQLNMKSSNTCQSDEEVFMLGGNYHGVLCDLEEMSAVKHLSADSSGALLNKVIVLDGVEVVKIAAGAEHSAMVTGKIIYHALITIYICNKVTLLNQSVFQEIENVPG